MFLILAYTAHAKVGGGQCLAFLMLLKFLSYFDMEVVKNPDFQSNIGRVEGGHTITVAFDNVDNCGRPPRYEDPTLYVPPMCIDVLPITVKLALAWYCLHNPHCLHKPH